MREPRDRLQGVPHAGRSQRSIGGVAQRLDAVALPINGMPERHQPARLGEEQEQQAVYDRQRLLERIVQRSAGVRPRHESAEHVGRRGKNAVPERPSDA